MFTWIHFRVILTLSHPFASRRNFYLCLNIWIQRNTPTRIISYYGVFINIRANLFVPDNIESQWLGYLRERHRFSFSALFHHHHVYLILSKITHTVENAALVVVFVIQATHTHTANPNQLYTKSSKKLRMEEKNERKK